MPQSRGNPSSDFFKAFLFPLYCSSFLRVTKVSSTRKVAVKLKVIECKHTWDMHTYVSIHMLSLQCQSNTESMWNEVIHSQDEEAEISRVMDLLCEQKNSEPRNQGSVRVGRMEQEQLMGVRSARVFDFSCLTKDTKLHGIESPGEKNRDSKWSYSLAGEIFLKTCSPCPPPTSPQYWKQKKTKQKQKTMESYLKPTKIPTLSEEGNWAEWTQSYLLLKWE